MLQYFKDNGTSVNNENNVATFQIEIDTKIYKIKSYFDTAARVNKYDYYQKITKEATTETTTTTTTIQSTAKQLQSTISTWYKVLRDLAIVAL